MVRKPLAFGASMALALQLVALPATAAAQEYTWTSDRPDGVPPAGMYAARMLPAGTFELAPSYRSYDFTGTRLGSQFVSYQTVLSLFELAPYAMSTDLFVFDAAYGLQDDLTLEARVGWAKNGRDLIDADGNVFGLESDGITDVEVHALWSVYEAGPWRAHLQAGVSIPTGSVDESDGVAGFRTAGTLPYDMQTGAGVVGLIPGATIQTMNESGSIGLQVLGRLYLGENDRGWRPGDAVEANGWVAYRFNRFFSVSSGLRASAWSAIEGFDADLLPARDPGEEASFFSGERVDVPLGVNLMIPEGPLAGHRLGVEFLFNVHEDFDGLWLAADDGFVITWRKAF